jgi:hypothetical protein
MIIDREVSGVESMHLRIRQVGQVGLAATRSPNVVHPIVWNHRDTLRLPRREWIAALTPPTLRVIHHSFPEVHDVPVSNSHGR